MSDTDLDLLSRFVRDHEQDAFTEIVQRHVNLVYSAALRHVRSPQAAEEVAQSVFTDLARNANRLQPGTNLTAWLYQVTHHTAVDVVRKESRRQLREQIAAEMNAMNAEAANWNQIEPMLDEAMQELDPADRTAILLRYFENKSLREVGQQLGVSDDAAQKRVSRAMERLREFFSKRNVSIGASGLVAVVTANAVQAAPAGLFLKISATALAGVGISTSAAVAGAKTVALTAFQKSVVVVSLAATATALLTYLLLRQANPAGTTNITQTTAKSAAQSQEPAQSAIPNTGVATTQAKPDALKLLRTVARARMQIHSGSMTFEYSLERFRNGFKETNQFRFVTLFDGRKLRFESYGKEFAYTYAEDETKQDEIIKRADSMDRQSAIQAGLTKAFSSHHIIVRDGNVLYDFWQTSDQLPSTTIDATTNGARAYVFDPRCLGLSTFLNVESSVEGCLGFAHPEFVGEENVDGIPAYHVRVRFNYGPPLDLWIDKTYQERLIQETQGLDIVKSKYDNANLNDPIPVEVDAMDFRNGILASSTRLTRSAASYNMLVDSTNFTLAGLGMPVRTPVNDIRIHRRIGYWTGSGLSGNFPPAKEKKSAAPPKLDDLLAVLENNPASSEALQSATWIILNTPDGPDVQEAAQVILQYHARDTNLVQLCQGLERVRPDCAEELLKAFLEDNPSVEVRGNACFTLATLLKSDSKHGQNRKATTQAELFYERAIKEFSMVKQRGYSLATLAKPELYELRNLIIGKPAPKTEGVDLKGRPLKLSTFRGRVTVVVFWSGYFTEALMLRHLKEDMDGKPFALVGVNCDDASTRKQESFDKVNWPTFRDGRDGPIARLWNVHSWSDIWVLDREGIIRYRGAGLGFDVRKAVNTLLAE